MNMLGTDVVENSELFLKFDQHKALGMYQFNQILTISEDYIRLVPDDAWPVELRWA